MTDSGVACFRSAALGKVGEYVTGLEDIAQSIQIILTTPIGAVPLDPEFGWEGFALLDQPIATSRRALVRASIRALRAKEPRIDPPMVTAVMDQDAAVALVITWSPKGDDSQTVVQAVSASTSPSGASNPDYVRRSEVGAPSGVAPLGTSGLVPERYLPAEGGHDFGEVL